jgi:alpha-D-ribose 1-methylphosphonate 5-triphosphate synthase subunit PhnL
VTAAVEIADLHKTFTLHTQGGVELPVLRGVSLSVGPGECVALGDPSGSGKSTLLRCVYGNYRPQRGRIVLRHAERRVDVVAADPRAVLDLRRTTVGYVSQFLRVIPRVPALDVVAEPLRRLGAPAGDAMEHARALLARLGIAERLWSLPPVTFSGGEQQRVNVARGLAAGHPILLLDEPTASLDADACSRVAQLIVEARRRGAAILGTFHDRHVRDAVSTRVAFLHGAGT